MKIKLAAVIHSGLYCVNMLEPCMCSRGLSMGAGQSSNPVIHSGELLQFAMAQKYTVSDSGSTLQEVRRCDIAL